MVRGSATLDPDQETTGRRPKELIGQWDTDRSGLTYNPDIFELRSAWSYSGGANYHLGLARDGCFVSSGDIIYDIQRSQLFSCTYTRQWTKGGSWFVDTIGRLRLKTDFPDSYKYQVTYSDDCDVHETNDDSFSFSDEIFFFGVTSGPTTLHLTRNGTNGVSEWVTAADLTYSADFQFDVEGNCLEAANEGNLSGGAIAGIVLGSVFGVILFITLLLFLFRNRLQGLLSRGCFGKMFRKKRDMAEPGLEMPIDKTPIGVLADDTENNF